MNQENLKAKSEVIAEVTESAKAASSIVVVEYRGLTVKELTQLRRDLRAANSDLVVYKNSLVERASDALGYEGLNDILTGPNAFVFSQDTIAGPKAIVKFARRNDKVKIKGGVVEGKFVNADQLKVVATLPGRDGLISMFLSVLNAPVRQFAVAVQAVADAK